MLECARSGSIYRWGTTGGSKRPPLTKTFGLETHIIQRTSFRLVSSLRVKGIFVAVRQGANRRHLSLHGRGMSRDVCALKPFGNALEAQGQPDCFGTPRMLASRKRKGEYGPSSERRYARAQGNVDRLLRIANGLKSLAVGHARSRGGGRMRPSPITFDYARTARSLSV